MRERKASSKVPTRLLVRSRIPKLMQVSKMRKLSASTGCAAYHRNIQGRGGILDILVNLLLLVVIWGFSTRDQSIALETGKRPLLKKDVCLVK